MNLKEQITGNPYNYDKVARCELDRVMKEDSMLRTRIGTGQLQTPLKKEDGFYLLSGKHIPIKDYEGLDKEAQVAMEEEWVKDEVFALYENWFSKYENDSEEFQDFAEMLRMD